MVADVDERSCRNWFTGKDRRLCACVETVAHLDEYAFVHEPAERAANDIVAPKVSEIIAQEDVRLARAADTISDAIPNGGECLFMMQTYDLQIATPAETASY